MIHNGMPYDQIQGQGRGGPKFVKMADFKVSVPLSVYTLCPPKNGHAYYGQ